MLNKTRGIVIRTIKYGEASAICNILTEQHGLLGFHIPSAYKPKSKLSISYFQTLNAVEISFNYRKTSGLQKISDITCHSYPDLSKFNQQAIYHVICELLQQTVRENEINQNLFNYLYNETLPGINHDLHYWQLPFVMLNVLYHYGCAPNIDTYSEGYCLDLQNGIFQDVYQPTRQVSDVNTSSIIYEMMRNGISHLENEPSARQKVIRDLITYYRLHISESFDLKSLDILSQVAR